MHTWLKHITHILSHTEVLAGYDRVAELYPYVPSLSMWRAWEYAAYCGRALEEPVLDIGCGDGRWFQLVWPGVTDVYGVDLEPAVVERARQSGVYRNVWQADAASMPVPESMFGTAFANCSLEHMDDIHTIMRNVWRSLRPGGLFVFSVVTDKLNDWFSLSALARALGEDALAHHVYDEWLRYHHLVNPFPVEAWCDGLIDAGFEVVEHIPIIPEMTGRLFLLIDGLWHTKRAEGELGDQLYPYLQDVPHFPSAFRGILQSALMMESNPQIGCGAVLVAKKVERAGQMVEHPKRRCWCGNQQLSTFSADYLSCAVCGTLVSQTEQSDEPPIARDDSDDYYGKQYWLSHQGQDLGLPDIYTRVRLDLPERCLHWLRTLLRYKQPPAKVLELGSAHGGFVAMLRWAGFDATGLELSPWVADFARRAFDVPMLLGAIEQQHLPEQSFDVIVLNDVLEHLSDPLGTLRHCAALLKPDGILFIQTPCYPEPQTYNELMRGGDRFVEMLNSREHLYLFSQGSVRQLFERLGYDTLLFMPPLFAYDMYFVASKQPLATFDNNETTARLISTPSGRMIQALLDKAVEVEQLQAQLAYTKEQLAASEADRGARLEVIERQGSELGRIPALEADIAYLQEQVSASEIDRAARLEVIERQGQELGRIPQLEAQLSASEADRAARLEVIERQGAELGQLSHSLAQYADRMGAIRNVLSASKLKYTAGLLPDRWKRIQQMLATPPNPISRDTSAPPLVEATPQPPAQGGLEAYIAEIDSFNSAQTNAALLDTIRDYNHRMIETLDQLRPLSGRRLLDIGASPHGYALERALSLGVAEYVGIGLDVEQVVEVHSASGNAKLLYMNAEQLAFPDQSFDLVISLSTFEHVGDVGRVLSEIKRVLKPGGSALITFEPIWTSSYGHHLHHFGPVARYMPDWAHLLWDKEQMCRELASSWPTDAAIGLDEAAAWTFESPAINRIGIAPMRTYFEQSGLEIEWMVLLPDEQRDPQRLALVAAALSISPDDLMAKGLSVLLNKAEATL